MASAIEILKNLLEGVLNFATFHSRYVSCDMSYVSPF